MKHYDHESRKWVTDEELEQIKAIKLKKSKTCRGGKPHNFILALPSHITASRVLSQEEIERYYAIEEKIRACNIEMKKEFLEIGIIGTIRQYSLGRNYKSYVCEACGKKEYK